mmetsp:Transcript_30493/g.62981  ORF Transcript_30493/g.62981 Transcript_30493/m.62981 type:complete len:128 (+) Transcript_30493:1422-1805(+)
MLSILTSWKRWVLRGGLVAPNVWDNEEAVFGDADPLPRERKETVRGLRLFLVDGQAEWRHNGGVSWQEPPRDPDMGHIMLTIERALQRRPTEVLQKWEDAREYVGTYWELDYVRGLPPELWETLVEC